MARMHSRKKGKAGSKRPSKEKTQPWVSYSAQEIEQLVLKIAKAGNSPSKIGMILRDNYGIPDVPKITGKKVVQILKDAKQAPELPEDLTSLIRKQTLLLKHIEFNKKDMASRRGLLLTVSKIRRLTKYYQRNSVLPKGWTYSAEQAKLIIG